MCPKGWSTPLILLCIFSFSGTAHASHFVGIVRVSPELEKLGLTFANGLKEELTRYSSAEIQQYEIRDDDVLRTGLPSWREAIYYRNDLKLQKRAFYNALTDVLNDWSLIRTMSEHIRRFTRVEIGFITETKLTLDPKLVPLTVPPQIPDPTAEVGFGEQTGKRVRFGIKFSDSSQLLISNKFSPKPLVYSRIHVKPLTIQFQLQFSATGEKTSIEVLGNYPVFGVKLGVAYDVQGSQLTMLLSRRIFGGNELRITPGYNTASGDRGISILLYSPFKF